MLESLRYPEMEKLFGIFFVLMLHGAALYGLWGYREISIPDEANVLMVNLINPPAPQPPKPQQLLAKTPVVIPDGPYAPPHMIEALLLPQPLDAREPQQLLAETQVVIPDEQVAHASPSVIEALPLPQPVLLSGELSVACPERPPPDYPGLSMRMNEQGKVVLRVEIGEDGRVANVEVKTSSGFRRLDDAALSAVKTWRCKPSVRNGVAVRAVALQPFNFILEGS